MSDISTFLTAEPSKSGTIGRNQANAVRIMRRVPFNEAYKEWRNRARKYDRKSIINEAICGLNGPWPDPVEELASAPWLTLLMVKWVCQDSYFDQGRLLAISPVQLEDLRKRLWDIQERVSGIQAGYLFLRQMARPQLGFQRDMTNGFARDAALLAELQEGHPLRKMFRAKTGFDVLEFIDLSLATSDIIRQGKRRIPDAWFTSLRTAYAAEVVSSYQSAIARTLPELVAFAGSMLSDAKCKVASEYYEFPILTRYPFFRRTDDMFCWHPMVFYRGLEGFVHSVLSEEDQKYIESFSRIFERHVVEEAKKVPARFSDENELREWIAPETKVPDGLLSFPGCNVFIESKAGRFNESVMAVGNSEIFANKTRAILKAMKQAWATSVSLRKERRAPDDVIDSDTDYLLVVTNKELGPSRGTALARMYPEDELNYPNAEAERLLPLRRIYVLAIDDFERLVNAAVNRQIDVPEFLASCVDDDSEPESASFLFDLRLDERDVPKQFSEVVEKAVTAARSRLEKALIN